MQKNQNLNKQKAQRSDANPPPAPDQMLRECARHGDVLGVLYWLVEGVSPDAANERGVTALHTAVSPEVIALLAEAGANFNVRGPEGLTPLHWTFETQDIEKARQLIACGADINARSDYGETPLRLAVETSGTYCVVAPKMARFLIESGADVNARDDQGQTTLRHASLALQICPQAPIGDSLEIIHLLRERGALLN